MQQLNQKVVAPLLMLNGFYVKGLATGWNIDGSGGLQAAGNSYLVVRDVAWSSVVGCTANPLAGPLTTAQLQTQVNTQLVIPCNGSANLFYCTYKT